MTKPSTTPWRIHPDYEWVIIDVNGRTVCAVESEDEDHDLEDANAALIIWAVNQMKG